MDCKENRRIRAKLKEFGKALNKSFSIRKMILFGSRARNDHLFNSDVDVIIVSDYFEGMNYIRRMHKVVGFWDEDLLLEPLCYTPEEFEMKKREIGIVRQAVKDGIEI